MYRSKLFKGFMLSRRGRILIKPFTLFMVALMLAQTCLVGCSNSVESEQNIADQAENARTEARPTGLADRSADRGGETPVLSIKANGTTVDVQSACTIGNSIQVYYTYQSATGAVLARQLILDNSLLHMTVYDERGVAMAGHEFELLADSTASYRVWSGRDQFMMKVAETDDSVTLLLSDGSRSTSISGSNETWAAKRGALLADAIGEYTAFATDDEDLATAEHLLADEVFVKFVFSEFGDDIAIPVHRQKLCAIAHLICTICSFLWECPPCWIPCVPACGIALACAIADLFFVGGAQ